MYDEPNDLFNRLLFRNARKTKYILLNIRNFMIYQSYGLEEIIFSEPK